VKWRKEKGHPEGQSDKDPGRPPVKRVTGSELEARFDTWRAERQARTDEERSQERGPFVVGVLGVLLVLLVGTYGLWSNSHQSAVHGNQERIAQLKEDLAVASEPGQAVDPKVLSDINARAVKSAKTVAEDQNTFTELLVDAGGEEWFVRMASQREDAADSWNEDAFLVPDGLAYGSGEEVEADVELESEVDADDQVDPRYPWFTSIEASNACTWEVTSVMVATDPAKVGSAEVMWTCRTSDEEVSAWATALYDEDDPMSEQIGFFDDLRVVDSTEEEGSDV